MTSHDFADDAIQIRVADRRDTSFLADNDDHVRPDVLADLLDAGRVSVAHAGERSVGWLRWNLFWDEIPFMNLLFVLAADRRRGIGTRLVAAWETAVRVDGHRMVTTSTRADEDAQHFYRKHGWVDCGSLLLPGEPSEIFLRKDLDAAIQK